MSGIQWEAIGWTATHGDWILDAFYTPEKGYEWCAHNTKTGLVTHGTALTLDLARAKAAVMVKAATEADEIIKNG